MKETVHNINNISTHKIDISVNNSLRRYPYIRVKHRRIVWFIQTHIQTTKQFTLLLFLLRFTVHHEILSRLHNLQCSMLLYKLCINAVTQLLFQQWLSRGNVMRDRNASDIFNKASSNCYRSTLHDIVYALQLTHTHRFDGYLSRYTRVGRLPRKSSSSNCPDLGYLRWHDPNASCHY